MTILNMPFVCANVLESSKYGDEFVGISYSSKYSKYFEGLPKDMRQFYILQPAMGIPHESRLGAQIIALKHTKWNYLYFFTAQFIATVWHGHNW